MTKTIQRRQAAPQQSLDLSQWPKILQTVLANRNVQNAKELDYGLVSLEDPNRLKGIDEAVQLLEQALHGAWRILIVGDFDADGATSCALAVTALKAMGATYVEFLVPNRFDYGYGLTPEIFEVAASFEPELIITVDNGISSLEGVAAAHRLGIEVLITDHHLPGKALPEPAIIVNPNQPGCAFPSKNLAGVGVIFYVMVALRGALRASGWFQDQNIAEPNMAEYLDLVAVGTVADVVPLDSNNRRLVYQGIQRIRHLKTRPGILAMLEVAGRQATRLSASDLGFMVGPRLNAAGRLDDMSLGIRCLLSTDPMEAAELANQLNDLNQDRRAIESSMQKEALQTLQSLTFNDDEAMPWGLCLYQAEWHQGVVGILASRIKDRYHRPVIAFADADSGNQIKGSARSIAGLHIRDALDFVATQNPGLISKFGGHAMAAGLSIERANFEDFSKAFDEAVRLQLSQDDLTETLYTDGELNSSDFNLELAQAIDAAGPWGQAFPEPLFDGEFHLLQQRIVGQKHLKMVVAPASDSACVLDAIAFSVDLDEWPNPSAQKVHLVYQLQVNEYRGRQSVQLVVRYFYAV